ncbi:uncharacterized protein LOC111410344 isoform X1 [Olea europaea var. sylvestris]|uniref:uncharacterized protein LOC111410344 isoform X1 n=1 Tax=Olea europaea var. sylvestris TaxID=158386 RepID=UPI000C1D5E6A|nr:uncharacterized protein LOC111410344 isoform X1 [Olea europaea var. sylvestris]XP_022896393.1 uncharacterized protein LOC111410344 isoform X1 [Olea europaea var. sylvestris]XP_022896394.1 uncharacterized protein LOC111410344 isoform X1 [Olea europaea var. sylvestris]
MVGEGYKVICNCVDGGHEVQYPKTGTKALLMGILVEEVAITMSCHCVKRQDPPFLTNYWAIRRGPSKESWPYQHGLRSMANDGQDTNGSQFFICDDQLVGWSSCCIQKGAVRNRCGV